MNTPETKAKCWKCGAEDNHGLYGGRFLCSVCDPDPSGWTAMHDAQREAKEKRRNAMQNISKRMKILDRVRFMQNDGVCLLDERFYYYAQKKTARKKGESKRYQMRGFKHFLDVFLKD